MQPERFFVGYHNLEVWGVAPKECPRQYVVVFPCCEQRYEITRLLLVPSAPIYSYLLIDVAKPRPAVTLRDVVQRM